MRRKALQSDAARPTWWLWWGSPKMRANEDLTVGCRLAIIGPTARSESPNYSRVGTSLERARLTTRSTCRTPGPSGATSSVGSIPAAEMRPTRYSGMIRIMLEF